MTASTLTEPTTDRTQQYDNSRYAHYVDKSKIVDASVTGAALWTLCGIKLIPSRDPDKLPVCRACKEIFDSIRPFMVG